MSVGNLKTYGNKGNNFPYQLNALKLASVSQLKNCSEITLNNANFGYKLIKLYLL
jgi:hypothetical protein